MYRKSMREVDEKEEVKLLDRGDGGNRCASSTDAPSNLGIRGYSDRGMEVTGAPHPQMPQVTWVSADTLTEGWR